MEFPQEVTHTVTVPTPVTRSGSGIREAQQSVRPCPSCFQREVNRMSTERLRTSRFGTPAAPARPRFTSAPEFGVIPGRYFSWKPFLDLALAVLLVVPGLPLLGVLIVVVRMTSRGPGIYRQRRVGKDGEPFSMYKIRTMVHDAEATTGPVWTRQRDPRVTFVGRVLRKLHLDELPQLFNVLKGEMSLIGPRPERPEFVVVLSQEVAHYSDRLAVRPGITGLAQLNLPPDTDLASVRRKLMLDLEYVKHAGPWLDLRILLATCARMLRLPTGLRLLGLKSYLPQPASSDPLAAGSDDPSQSLASPIHLMRGASPHPFRANGHSRGNGKPPGSSNKGAGDRRKPR